MIFLWLSMMALDNWPITDTGISREISYQEFGVAHNDIFILDQVNCKVLHYDATGKAIGSFGEKGQGPGKLAMPTNLKVFGNMVYVADFNGAKVAVYSFSGHLKKEWRGLNVVACEKTAYGWTRLERPSINSPESFYKVHFADLDPNQTTPVIKWQGATIPGPKRDGEKTIMFYNPAMDHPALLFGNNGTTAYLYRGGKMEVELLDLKSKKITGSYAADYEPIPFDTQWGQQRLTQLKQRAAMAGAQMVWKEIFPTHFPPVSWMRVGPRENLWVLHGPRELEQHQLIVFSPTGQQIEAPFKLKHLYNYVGTGGGFAYFRYFDRAKNRLIIQRWPLDDLESYQPVQ